MRKNIILITVDSLRVDHVGHLSNRVKYTPCIDSLAEKGASYTHAYANGIPTYFAFRSILGGRRDINTDDPIGLPIGWHSLADEFSERGYETAGFNAANPWLTESFHYDSGFDTFVDFLNDDSSGDETSPLVKGMQRVQHRIPEEGQLRDKLGLAARAFCSFTKNFPIKSCEAVTKKAVQWLNSRSSDSPFFLWVHYMDPHYPWTPASKEISSWEVARTWHEVAHIYNKSDQQPEQSTLESVNRLYAREVKNVDSAIGKIINHSSNDEKTIVCVTADHGTELGDHGGFSHGPASLYNEVTHVPLVLSGPEIQNRTISSPVQHIDIPTTLIELANSESNKEFVYDWPGNNLLDEQREFALTEVIYNYNPAASKTDTSGILCAIVCWPWKLHWNQHLDEVELYNLAEDPHETEDLSVESQSEVQKLKGLIRDEQKTTEVESRTATEILRIRECLRRLEA
ncbi:sulfatase [Haladaptatus sp. QDMS2]|nr:sulfatase [Haladaptatus sp. QDMS2]